MTCTTQTCAGSLPGTCSGLARNARPGARPAVGSGTSTGSRTCSARCCRDEAADRSRALMWDVPRYLDAMALRGTPGAGRAWSRTSPTCARGRTGPDG